MDVIKNVFTFIRDWAEVFLVGVGLLVLLVYWLQKRDQVRNAATELKEQIVEIEDSIKALKEPLSDLNPPKMYQLGPILTDNLWQKNRSILSSHLCEEDRKLIQDFYLSAERIERARFDLAKCMIFTWHFKSFLCQRNLLECYLNSKLSDNCRRNMDLFIQDTYVFDPTVCKTILSESSHIRSLIGTTTYQKLIKLSKN